MTTTALDTIPAEPAHVPSWITLLLAVACGVIVANIYYAQPLIALISTDLGLSPATAGLIVTATQIGYGAGLLLLVPLADLFENRRLVLVVVAIAACALAAAASATSAVAFLVASLLIGFGSVAVQILVPYAAHLAPESVRGQTVGKVVSGLLLGIMLARPLASFLTDLLSWRAVFGASTMAMFLVIAVLARALPPRMPAPGLGYAALLRSMGELALTQPVLRRRALYQAALFGGFSVFWTAVPLLLAQRFGLSQTGIALFALAGVAGAVAAPLAGRAADRELSRVLTPVAIALVSGAFLLSKFATDGSTGALFLLALAGIVLDFGVSANLVFGQRAVYGLGAAIRSRVNGLFMATFFAGGAVGSAVGAWAYARGGWDLASSIGAVLPLLALGYFATEGRSIR
jgi:predicted MFS family arabinose efflux permease